MVNQVLCAVTNVAIAFDASMITTCCRFNCNSLNLLGLSLLTTLNLYIPSFFFVCELFLKCIDSLAEFFLGLDMFLILLLEIVNFNYVLLYL